MVVSPTNSVQDTSTVFSAIKQNGTGPTALKHATIPCTTSAETTLTEQPTAHKKKKKKKSKKTAKSKASNATKALEEEEGDRPPVLCISRNKHWRYISSYHGPWLQLPVELLESLLVINLDPATLTASEARVPLLSPSHSHSNNQVQRPRGFASLSDHSPPDSPHSAFANLPPPPPLPAPKPGKATPPPIDPGVFRSITHIRRLIDEASELSVRASSGLSAAALGNMRGPNGFPQSPWGLAHQLGLAGENNNGRTVAMSAMRIHRLRALAVQKLAAAYKADEIASSVMVMQGGSVFDDIAERVLRVDPHDSDARYVHFFHEKIPSRSHTRQLAESTTTEVLDHLIAMQPHRLEFFRTRGIVHCFRDEFSLAVKDFTHVLRESRAQRRAKAAHHSNGMQSEQRSKGKKRKGKAGSTAVNGQAPEDGTSSPVSTDGPTIDGPDGEPMLLHPSVLPDAPDPIEPQCLFLRGAAYLQHAVYLIEEAILKLEGIRKEPTADGAELRLCYVENGRYGGVEIGNPYGPLGNPNGKKLLAYKEVLANDSFRDTVFALLRKSVRDHERFLSHFDTLEAPPPEHEANMAQKVEHAFLLSQSFRPGSQNAPPTPLYPDSPAMFTTYHPLLVESHFSILISLIMLGNFPALLPTFYRSAMLVDGLEGYPVFLPPRSMAQAEFIEVLERLAGGWRNGVQPHSLVRSGVLAVELASRSAKAKEVERAPPPITVEVPSSSSSATLSPGLPAWGINGSSSSSAVHNSNPPSGRDTPSSAADRVDLVESLDCARMLLVPVAAKQKEKAEKAAAEKAAERAAGKTKKKPMSINIPLHGPRVEIILAWLAAVHLVELDSVA